MSERKVLNKYYPPDFDPSKIPRMHLSKERQYTIRTMAPFNMRCTTCGEYIYKGKKFNSRKETVQNEDYLGLRIYRFYIKCTRCLAEITFKTDPKNTDYEIEHGATRNFQALKLAEEQAEKEEKERVEEEESNQMKLMEKRQRMSKNEMDALDALEELQEMNQRHTTVDFESMLARQAKEKQARIDQELLDEEQLIKSIFAGDTIKRLDDSGSSDGEDCIPESIKQEVKKLAVKPTEILSAKEKQEPTKKNSILALKGMVKIKRVNDAPAKRLNDDAAAAVVEKRSRSRSPVREQPQAKPVGLQLLAGYSDSDSNGSND